MKAIVLKDIDSNIEQLELFDMPQPLIKSSTDVLIRTSFASINPVDYKLGIKFLKYNFVFKSYI